MGPVPAWATADTANLGLIVLGDFSRGHGRRCYRGRLGRLGLDAGKGGGGAGGTRASRGEDGRHAGEHGGVGVVVAQHGREDVVGAGGGCLDFGGGRSPGQPE